MPQVDPTTTPDDEITLLDDLEAEPVDETEEVEDDGMPEDLEEDDDDDEDQEEEEEEDAPGGPTEARRRRGRPVRRKGTHVSIRVKNVPRELDAIITRLAEARRVSKSEFILDLLRQRARRQRNSFF